MSSYCSRNIIFLAVISYLSSQCHICNLGPDDDRELRPFVVKHLCGLQPTFDGEEKLCGKAFCRDLGRRFDNFATTSGNVPCLIKDSIYWQIHRWQR